MSKLDNTVGDFKKFVNKGNIFDLAVGVIIGSTFNAIVNSLVSDIITPLISAAIKFDLTDLKWVIQEAVLDDEGNTVKSAITMNYGNFFQNVIKFVIVAVSIFVAVKAVNAIKTGYIKHEIEFLQKLQKKHPEYFDEDTDFGTKEYERLKREHPELFKNEEAEAIEQEKAQVQAKSPQEVTNDLLLSIKESLDEMNHKTEQKNDEEKDS